MNRQRNVEHRDGARVAFETRVHLHGADGVDIVLMSVDWTRRSVFLRTRSPFSLGVHVEMYAIVGRPAELVRFSGSVTRTIAADGSPTLEPGKAGMAVVFKEMPKKLRQVLDEILSRRRVHDFVNATLAAPTALVVGEPPLAHSAACRSLTANGYEVTEAFGTADAQEKLEKGLSPAALVVFEDIGERLAWLRDDLSQTDPPQVAITIGCPPRDLDDGLGFPVLSLPPLWPVDRLPMALAPFVSGAVAQPVILRNADEEHGYISGSNLRHITARSDRDL